VSIVSPSTPATFARENLNPRLVRRRLGVFLARVPRNLSLGKTSPNEDPAPSDDARRAAMVFSPDPEVLAATRNITRQRRYLREDSGVQDDRGSASDDSRARASTAGSNPGTGASNPGHGDANRNLAGPSRSISAIPEEDTPTKSSTNPSADPPSENTVVIAVPDQSAGAHRRRRHRRRAGPPFADCVGGCDGSLPPHDPFLVDAFAAVILALYTVGVVACAVAFPIQGARDADASERRWEVTLARWSAARAHPGVPRLAGLYDSSAGAGVGAFFPEDVAAGFDFTGDEDAEDVPAEGPEGSSDAAAAAAAAAAVDAPAPLGA
jgi:hypothetical protein